MNLLATVARKARAAALAPLSLLATQARASASSLIQSSSTSSLGASIGQPWLDTVINNVLGFLWGPGLMIIGAYSLYAGVQRIRAAQEKGEYINGMALTLLTVALCAGGGGIYNWMHSQASSASATGFILHHLR